MANYRTKCCRPGNGACVYAKPNYSLETVYLSLDKENILSGHVYTRAAIGELRDQLLIGAKILEDGGEIELQQCSTNNHADYEWRVQDVMLTLKLHGTTFPYHFSREYLGLLIDWLYEEVYKCMEY